MYFSVILVRRTKRQKDWQLRKGHPKIISEAVQQAKVFTSKRRSRRLVNGSKLTRLFTYEYLYTFIETPYMNPSFLDIFYQKKERRPGSLNRNFYSDYIGMDDKPNLKNLVGRRDKIQFAQTVQRYDRKFKVIVPRTL